MFCLLLQIVEDPHEQCQTQIPEAIEATMQGHLVAM